MNKKFLSTMAYMLICMMTLISCSDTNDGNEPKGGQPDPSDLIAYQTRTVTVNRGGTDGGTVQLRLYEDMPNVPYIAVGDFQSLMLPGTAITVEQNAPGEYTLTGPYAKATVSTTNDTFSSDDYMSFTNLMDQVRPNTANVYLDGSPYIRYSRMELSPATATVTFDFKKYDIDLRAGNGTVYFPFITLSALYSDLYYHIAAYNGEKVVVITDNNMASIAKLEPEQAQKVLEATVRPADVAEFGYKQLCFNVDHFYGMPGRSRIESGIKAMGLDKTLDELPTGALAKQLLTSTKTEEYFMGMTYLQALLADGGHTMLTVDKNAIKEIDGNSILQWFTDILQQANNYPELEPEIKECLKAMVTSKSFGIEPLRNEVLPGEGTYRTSGNTAYCLLGTFGPTNFEAWNAYYKGGCQGNTPAIDEEFSGDLSVVIEALKAAEADPQIKNFVVDLTCNFGGSLDVVLAMTQLMAGQSHFYCTNTLTGQRQTIYYDVDANFDGKFDEKDKEVKYNLNYAVLTSEVAFSCGNLFPSLMKDAGYPIIGQKSGGGACAIQLFTTPEGLQYQLSSARARLASNQWENIDGGITPTHPIEIGPELTIESFTIGDYSNFWEIGSLIDNIYK